MPVEPINNDKNYHTLVQQIGDRYAKGRAAAVTAVNHELVLTYWEIGRYIVEFEQEGKAKAAYGKGLLKQLSKDLSTQYGKGFSKSNLNPPPPAPSTNNKPSSKNGVFES